MRRAVAHRVAAAALLAVAAMAPARSPVATATPTTPPAILVGDSVVSLQQARVTAQFRDRGLADVRMEAFAGRAIDRPMYYPSVGWVQPGTTIVAGLRAQGIDAPLWIVELGANDLSQFDGPGAGTAARRLIDTMRTAIGDRQIVWVTVQTTLWPAAVAAFNQALYDVAAVDPRFLVVDWADWSAGRPWFTDHVHLNNDGGTAIGRCLAGATRYAIALRQPPADDRARRLGLVGDRRMPACSAFD